jgi:hypothetical protein
MAPVIPVTCISMLAGRGQEFHRAATRTRGTASTVQVIPWYLVTVVTIERVQTGLRIERNTLKVLKGLAEYLDLSLGDLVEGIVLHAFEGKAPFGPPTLDKIDQLKAVYGLELTAADAHKLQEQP